MSDEQENQPVAGRIRSEWALHELVQEFRLVARRGNIITVRRLVDGRIGTLVCDDDVEGQERFYDFRLEGEQRP
jgi:hypothetical protein